MPPLPGKVNLGGVEQTDDLAFVPSSPTYRGLTNERRPRTPQRRSRDGIRIMRCLLKHNWVLGEAFDVQYFSPWRKCGRCGLVQRGTYDKERRDVIWEPMRERAYRRSHHDKIVRQPLSAFAQVAHTLGLYRTRKSDTLTTNHTLPWRDRVRIGFHLTMAWVLLIGSSAIVFGFPVVLINVFQTDLESLAAFWGTIWFLAGLLTSVAVLAIAWSYLFLVLWFTYLKALRHDVRRNVEEGLPSALNAFLFEPIYGRVRRRFFFDKGA